MRPSLPILRQCLSAVLSQGGKDKAAQSCVESCLKGLPKRAMDSEREHSLEWTSILTALGSTAPQKEDKRSQYLCLQRATKHQATLVIIWTRRSWAICSMSEGRYFSNLFFLKSIVLFLITCVHIGMGA